MQQPSAFPLNLVASILAIIVFKYLQENSSWPTSSKLYSPPWLSLDDSEQNVRRQVSLDSSLERPENQLDYDVATAGDQIKRVCYFRMDPKTEIRLSQVDGKLCTHIIMAFVRIDSSGNICLAANTDLSYLLEVAAFKHQFPAVKMMVSVFNEFEHNGFPKAALNFENRQRFAQSSMKFLRQYQLDGLDLDWEFPNFPAFIIEREEERTGLTRILELLRSAITEEYHHRLEADVTQSPVGALNNQEPYLLTMAIAAQRNIQKASYELAKIANLCDWLNIMSYDYFLYKPYAPFTGPNSPLNSVSDSYIPLLSDLSIAWTLRQLLKDGIKKEKIVMGIPTYARAYRLAFRNKQPAPFSLADHELGGRISDYLDYREVSDLLLDPDTIAAFDLNARVPYLLADLGHIWVSYENPQSVREKVHFVLSNKLAGYMTWNLNSDDYLGIKNRPINLANLLSSRTGSATNCTTSDCPLDPRPFPLHRAMLDEANQFSKLST